MSLLFFGELHNAKGFYVDLVAQKEAVVNAIRAEINLATAQELITVRVLVMHRTIYLITVTQKTSEKCYAKCVPKPGTSLTSSEEARSVFEMFVVMSHRVSLFRRA